MTSLFSKLSRPEAQGLWWEALFSKNRIIWACNICLLLSSNDDSMLKKIPLWYKAFFSNKHIERWWLHSIVNILKPLKCWGKIVEGVLPCSVLMEPRAALIWRRSSWSFLALYPDWQQPEDRDIQPWEELSLEDGKWRMCPRADHGPQPHPWANKVEDEWGEWKSPQGPRSSPLGVAVGEPSCLGGMEKEVLN